MTLFAVVQAGLFPAPPPRPPWFVYWLVPYPATMAVWPQFRSALPWDAAAVSTYFTVSLLFWYLGLVPDLAALRDRAPEPRAPASSTASSRSAGAAPRGTGATIASPTGCSPGSRRRSCSRCTRS